MSPDSIEMFLGKGNLTCEFGRCPSVEKSQQLRPSWSGLICWLWCGVFISPVTEIMKDHDIFVCIQYSHFFYWDLFLEVMLLMIWSCTLRLMDCSLHADQVLLPQLAKLERKMTWYLDVLAGQVFSFFLKSSLLNFQGNKFFSFLRWMCGTRSSSPGSLMVSQCINPSVQVVPTPSQWLPGMWRQCLGCHGDDWIGCGMERGAIQFDSSLQFHSCNCENLSITCQSSIKSGQQQSLRVLACPRRSPLHGFERNDSLEVQGGDGRVESSYLLLVRSTLSDKQRQGIPMGLKKSWPA